MVDVFGGEVLLHWRALDPHRGLGIADRAADKVAHAAEVDAEGRLDVILARQQVADHRHVIAVDRGEQQRRPAVELFHQAGDFEMRIDRRAVGRKPPALGHAVERRAKARVQHKVGLFQHTLPGASLRGGIIPASPASAWALSLGTEA